jgi:hypothetical protein
MDTIFTVEDVDEYNEKINLDDLYDRKQQHNINTINNYNTILNRIHQRIKNTSRKQLNEQFCWFVVPEIMIGVPKYDSSTCITYVMDKLQDNGFRVRYTHPNLLLISWSHWVPSYVRNEIKKQTGVSIDGYGNLISDKSDNDKKNTFLNNNDNPNMLIFNNNNADNFNNTDNKNNAKSITTYKPSGSLIYNNDLLQSLQDNLTLK